MAAPKRATHRVIQSGLYFNRNTETGRLEELKIGTHLYLDTSQAKSLESRGMVEPFKEVKVVNASDA